MTDTLQVDLLGDIKLIQDGLRTYTRSFEYRGRAEGPTRDNDHTLRAHSVDAGIGIGEKASVPIVFYADSSVASIAQSVMLYREVETATHSKITRLTFAPVTT